MAKGSRYQSKSLDKNGIISWSESENEIWRQLLSRQMNVIQGKACEEYLDGLLKLDLPLDRAPQLGDVSKVLQETTGWQCEPVEALIDFDTFFDLLSKRRFPVATFLRTKEDFDYLQEPDFFHEVFGHCAMLTHPAFAAFTQRYGMLGKAANKEDRRYLARLYWFTVEFGLMDCSEQGQRIYGGGILSSPKETEYAFFSNEPQRKPFEIVDVLRTPYRIDILQTVYFVIDGIEQLMDVSKQDIPKCIAEAKRLGMHEPTFTQKAAASLIKESQV
ncbi:phenylalanine 4-monooxygenase [Parasalinivibrio latis]|uniref:phenylalanine 4-monooxygenase n=1 Tax=Parasalinivibrio latis TaxID=2952610 RepID=UPI0030E2F5F9